MNEHHPASSRARFVRLCRSLHTLRGWTRFANWLVPEHVGGEFLVANDGVLFAGNLESFVDRQTYLFGQYEERSLELFFCCIPRKRRGVILDVGANAGTHSLVFARSFKQVHAFEPNPRLWPQFERNVQANRYGNVTLHKVGLAEHDAELPFHAIEKRNYGLGTFSTVEQYDLPLKRIGTCQVVQGDRYLAEQGIAHIDAVKIDVQGFEPNVLRGLSSTLQRCKPVVWFELGAGTQGMQTATQLKALFPFEHRLLRMREIFGAFTVSIVLQRVGEELQPGNYIIVP